MCKSRAMTFIVGLLLASIAGAGDDGRVILAQSGWLLQAHVKEISGYRQWARMTPEPQPQPVISPTGLD